MWSTIIAKGVGLQKSRPSWTWVFHAFDGDAFWSVDVEHPGNQQWHIGDLVTSHEYHVGRFGLRRMSLIRLCVERLCGYH